MPPPPKLTSNQINTVRALKAADPDITQEALAERFGVGRTTIAAALRDTAPAAEPSIPGMLMLSTAEILISGLNPRKTFDEAAVAELAASIAENGLLQNLVVSRASNGFYNIVAGERRFRAIRLLEERGEWNEKFACKLVEGTDAEHIAIALLENLARENVPPLEEADAFAQLQSIDAKTWTASKIAAKIGKSARFVQQRLALAHKLSVAARAALARGDINIEAARLLCTASPQIQEDILDRATAPIDVEDIRWELQGTLIPVTHAIFDVPDADLEIVEMDRLEFFADRKAFIAAQMAAVAEQEKKLKKQWNWVKLLDVNEPANLHLYATGNSKKEGGGAIIEISRTYLVTIHSGLVKRATLANAPSVSRPPSPPAVGAPASSEDADQPRGPTSAAGACPATDGETDSSSDSAVSEEEAEAEFTEADIETLVDAPAPANFMDQETDLAEALETLLAEAMPGLTLFHGTLLPHVAKAWLDAIDVLYTVKSIEHPKSFIALMETFA